MAVIYRIQVDKDGANVTAQFDVRVTELGSSELLADFHLNVEGQNLVPDFTPGQKRFNGTRNYVLKNPNQDAPVTFDIATNESWTKSDSCTLRGEKLRDQCLFAN